MPLTVLNVAHPLEAVSFGSTGGAEQVIALLDAALTRGGHRSLVIGRDGSQVQGRLIATPGVAGGFDEMIVQRAQELHRLAIEESLSRWPIDVVHLHGLHFYRYLPPAGLPVLVTLHMMPNWYPQQVFWPCRTLTFLQCVSEAQRRACPPGVPPLPVIENGVPVDRLARKVRKRDFVLSVGRISPEKGFHIALDAATRAGIPMLLAGQASAYSVHAGYFAKEIAPRLSAQRRFIGHVGFKRKSLLLSAARCLLVPSLVAETSSLIAMESLACGTPVVAFKAGALVDIIEHGKTGFLVEDERGMADAIAGIGALDARDCRRAARERFSAERMTARYLTLYENLAGLKKSARLMNFGEGEWPLHHEATA